MYLFWKKGESVKKIVEIAHDMILSMLQEESVAVDFTLGQGNDTLFLAQQKNIQHVYGFDIQKSAIEQSKMKLCEYEDKVTLILDGHEHMDMYVDGFDVGIFNFGFLPHGNEAITTLLETSKIAVYKALRRLRKKGIIVMVLYPGHAQGKEESLYFDEWCKKLDGHYFNVLTIRFDNRNSAPYIKVIERIRNEI